MTTTSLAFLLVCLLSGSAAAQRPALVGVNESHAMAIIPRGSLFSVDFDENTQSYTNYAVSSNGRFAVFESGSPLTSGAIKDEGSTDIFLRDLQTGVTTLVSVNSTGNANGNWHSYKPSISADGRFVAFESMATDLVTNDNNNRFDIFVRDMQTGVTTLVSVNSAGNTTGAGSSTDPVISASGRFVTFESTANNLDPRDNNTARDIFVRDLQTGVTSLVSVNSAGTASGNKASFHLLELSRTVNNFKVISADGRFVVFESQATDLVGLSDTNGKVDVFVRDMTAGVTTLLSINSAGTATADNGGSVPVISANGEVVVFRSSSRNIIAPQVDGDLLKLYARNLKTGVTVIVSGHNSSQYGDGAHQVISADGRFVAFQNTYGGLVAKDTNAGHPLFTDVFVKDLQTGTIALVSLNASGTDSGNSTSYEPSISADGRYVCFISLAQDLLTNPDQPYNGGDVFVRDMREGVTTFVSVGAASNTNNGRSERPSISDNGQFVFFTSKAVSRLPAGISGPQLGDFLYAVAVNDQLQFATPTFIHNEGGSSATVNITRTASASGPLTINYTTSYASALAGADFTPVNGTLTFAAGETSKSFTIPILDDALDENDETLLVMFSDFTGSNLTGSLGMASLVITDDDPLPSLSINDVTFTEGDGNVAGLFTVSLSAPSGRELSVDITPVGGTAQGSSDFHFNSTKVVIAPGTTSLSVPVTILGDLSDEFDETFTFNLSNPINATIARGQGTGTIVDNDPPPSVFLNDVGIAEGNSGTKTFNFSVRLSVASGKPVKVDYSTEDKTAKAGVDYMANSGTLVYSPGETVKLASITVNGDTLIETNETFFVNLSNPENASLEDSQGVGTIVDDDDTQRIPLQLIRDPTDPGPLQIAALDSVLLLRDPFPVVNPANVLNEGADKNTRIIVFVANLQLVPGEASSSVMVNLTDASGRNFDVEAEDVRLVPLFNFTQVKFRLPNTLAPGRCTIKVKAQGQESNAGTIRISN